MQQLECAKCSYVTTHKGTFERHVQSQHSEKRYVCDICGSEHKRADHLSAHLRLHNQMEIFKCEMCTYGTNLIQNLKRHVQDAHQKVKVTCKTCGNKFPAYNKKRHIERCRHRMVLQETDMSHVTEQQQQQQEQEQQKPHAGIRVRPKRNPCINVSTVSQTHCTNYGNASI